MFQRHVSITAEALRIQVVRPVLVPQVTTPQLFSHVIAEKVQADAAAMQSVENFDEICSVLSRDVQSNQRRHLRLNTPARAVTFRIL